MIYKHWSSFDGDWRWDNFTPEEMSCPLTGEYYHDPHFMDMLQKARDIRGVPFKINSAHRSPEHNAAVGGAKASAHLKIAADISLINHTKEELLEALFEAGFTTFGMYNTFIHTDPRPWRKWIVSTGALKMEWEAIYNKIVKRGK